MSLLDRLDALDRSAFLAINGAHSPWADDLMLAVSDMRLWFPLYLFFLYLLQRRSGWRGLAWSVPVLALMIFCSDTGSVALFKETAQRLRPCHEPSLQGLVHLVYPACGGQYGFVSSHASNHFAIAVFHGRHVGWITALGNTAPPVLGGTHRLQPRVSRCPLSRGRAGGSLVWCRDRIHLRPRVPPHHPPRCCSEVMNVWLAVFIGGGIGSLMRFGTTRLLLALDLRGAFPWATLGANVLSTLILAFALLRWQQHFQDRQAMGALITVGICGGFSTFSTFSYENFLLIREGMPGWAVINIAVNVLACLSIFFFVARTA